MSLLESITACGSPAWKDRFISKIFRSGAIVVSGVEEMVERAIITVGPSGSILELGILDHGDVPEGESNWVQLGADKLYQSDVATGGTEAWQALGRLKGLFAGEGYLFFMNCGAGQSIDILKWAAALVGAPAYGGTGYESGLAFNDGYYVVAWPNGSYKTRVERPRTSIASAILGSDPRTAPAVGRSIGEKLRDLRQ